jgi:hypothetical protein
VSRQPDGRTIASFVLVLVLALALASTLFTREEGVDPRPLLLVVGAVIAAAPLRRLVTALPLDSSRVPSLRAVPARKREAEPTPGALAVWIGRVNGGTTSARAASVRLIPAMREIARVRLADRRGISLDHAPEEAAAALGPLPWMLLRPDAAINTEGSAPGLGVDVIDAAVTTLEEL